MAGLPEHPTYDEVKALSYTKAVMMETLRCVLRCCSFLCSHRCHSAVAECSCACNCNGPSFWAVPVCRLYPSVPKDGVQAVRDVTFPDGTFVKKGVRAGATTFFFFVPSSFCCFLRFVPLVTQTQGVMSCVHV